MMPRSQKPEPEPGVDIKRSYSWRFRDPGFLAIWDRWWKARDGWDKAWKDIPFPQIPDLYAPDPALIQDPARRAAAQEFLDARTAYHAEIDRRDQE